MKRTLVCSNTFVRAAKHLLKKHPHLANDLQAILTLLSEDAFQPKLKMHKLKDSLEGSWACSGRYD